MSGAVLSAYFRISEASSFNIQSASQSATSASQAPSWINWSFKTHIWNDPATHQHNVMQISRMAGKHWNFDSHLWWNSRENTMLFTSKPSSILRPDSVVSISFSFVFPFSLTVFADGTLPHCAHIPISTPPSRILECICAAHVLSCCMLWKLTDDKSYTNTYSWPHSNNVVPHKRCKQIISAEILNSIFSLHCGIPIDIQPFKGLYSLVKCIGEKKDKNTLKCSGHYPLTA